MLEWAAVGLGRFGLPSLEPCLRHLLTFKRLSFLINYGTVAPQPDLRRVLGVTFLTLPLCNRARLVPSVLKVFFQC